MNNVIQSKLLAGFSDFVITHCVICAAGWTRIKEDGQVVIHCLLNREPVIPTMTDCDRFELREETASPPQGSDELAET